MRMHNCKIASNVLIFFRMSVKLMRWQQMKPKQFQSIMRHKMRYFHMQPYILKSQTILATIQNIRYAELIFNKTQSSMKNKK